MFGSKQSKPQNRIDSLIGHDTKIEGNLHFEGGLRVDGMIKGDVIATGDKAGTLVISEKATIEGTIRVGHLIVNGRIHGPVFTSHYVELQPKSQIIGDVHYKVLEMHPGAIIDGRLVHMHDPHLLTAPASATDEHDTQLEESHTSKRRTRSSTQATTPEVE